jgi:hypothetical protein
MICNEELLADLHNHMCVDVRNVTPNAMLAEYTEQQAQYFWQYALNNDHSIQELLDKKHLKNLNCTYVFVTSTIIIFLLEKNSKRIPVSIIDVKRLKEDLNLTCLKKFSNLI